MAWDKIAKAFLITLGGLCTAITANDFFSQAHRAYAGVVLGGSGPLLAYLLKPKSDTPQEVTGPAGGPVETTEQKP